MAVKTFVDTNILVYAHDLQAGAKQLAASEEIQRLWEHRSGVLSLQVLQEFYVTLTQKIAKPLPAKTAAELIESYGLWETAALDVKDVIKAIALQRKYGFSFWDSLIVQAALLADCEILLTEDLQHGQKIGYLAVRNPFK